MAFNMDDYVDVAARIREFTAKHPEGSLQPVWDDVFRVVEIGGQTFIAYAAAAYRTPDDPRPGIGTAYEPFPGRTPYTKDSELQNAETSAWGRAVIAALSSESKKIASAEEVRNRQADRDVPAQRRGTPSPFDPDRFVKACADKGVDPSDVLAHAQIDKPLSEITAGEKPALMASLVQLAQEPAA